MCVLARAYEYIYKLAHKVAADERRRLQVKITHVIKRLKDFTLSFCAIYTKPFSVRGVI